METTVKQMLSGKAHNELWTNHPESSVYDALIFMADKNIGALPVLEDDILVGIFSERDYARNIPLVMDMDPKDVKIREVMTGEVFCISPNSTAQQCLAIMTEKRIRHLPVFQEEKVVGIITIGDLTKQIISDQETLIGHLDYYITGGA